MSDSLEMSETFKYFQIAVCTEKAFDSFNSLNAKVAII